MIEKLSGTPTQKCNLLESSIFNNTHSMNLSRCAQNSYFPPTFIHFFCLYLPPSLCVSVIITAAYRRGAGGCAVRGEAPFKLNVFFTQTGNDPSHTHATVHPIAQTHRNTCVTPAMRHTHT